jgi:hypothetical protein
MDPRQSGLRFLASQPPEINETFLREVDENLRRDQLRDFAKEYGGWLVSGLILFLIACGGVIYWQHYKQRQSERQVEQIAAIYKDIGSSKLAKVPSQLDELAKSRNDSVRASALFTRAALAIQQNDQTLAIAKYREVAEDGDLPKPYRDAATIRRTALEFDKIKPDEVISRLEPLAKPGDPWFASAGEMTALALIKQGKKAEAGRLFATIAKDKSVPDPVRARSAQIAGTLGVDASAALDALNQ